MQRRINDELVNDDSWSVALSVVRGVHIPPALSQLLRGCQGGVVAPEDLLRVIGSKGLSPRSIVRAAQISDHTSPVSTKEIMAAVDMLGVKASSIILAINCVCEQILSSGPALRLWAPMFKEMMSEIELGYHVGSSVEQLGIEQGMLVGFSRLAGLGVLLKSSPDSYEEWHARTSFVLNPTETLEAFGCEPYQVSSLLMQQLGLGIEVALATASTLGQIDSTIIESKPLFATWRATSDWIGALRSGAWEPESSASRELFWQLSSVPGAPLLPSHISALRDQATAIRSGNSQWTWHLPLSTYEETAKSMVYKRNNNPFGASWSRSLEA
jgi:hypothetical protein